MALPTTLPDLTPAQPDPAYAMCPHELDPTIFTPVLTPQNPNNP